LAPGTVLRTTGTLDVTRYVPALVKDRRLWGLVQIGRFLGNTQPQVRTLSGPFI